MGRGWSDSEFSEPKEIEQIRFRVIALQGHGRAIQYVFAVNHFLGRSTLKLCFETFALDVRMISFVSA